MTKQHPRPIFIFLAVLFTISSAIIVYSVRLNYAFDNFRKVNHLPERTYKIFFGTFHEPAEVSIKDLPNGSYFWGVLFLAVMMLGIYPLLGKVLAHITALLEETYIDTYKIDVEKRNHPFFPWEKQLEKFEFGAIWPFSIFYTIFLIIANLVGGIYREIWKEF